MYITFEHAQYYRAGSPITLNKEQKTMLYSKYWENIVFVCSVSAVTAPWTLTTFVYFVKVNQKGGVLFVYNRDLQKVMKRKWHMWHSKVPLVVGHALTLKVLNFWKFTSYCSLKPLWSGMGEVVPARTSPTLHPPSPPTVHQLSRLAL